MKNKLIKDLNTFENIMEIGAFAPNEQMLHFPKYCQVHDISKALLWSKVSNKLIMSFDIDLFI